MTIRWTWVNSVSGNGGTTVHKQSVWTLFVGKDNGADCNVEWRKYMGTHGDHSVNSACCGHCCQLWVISPDSTRGHCSSGCSICTIVWYAKAVGWNPVSDLCKLNTPHFFYFYFWGLSSKHNIDYLKFALRVLPKTIFFWCRPQAPMTCRPFPHPPPLAHLWLYSGTVQLFLRQLHIPLLDPRSADALT